MNFLPHGNSALNYNNPSFEMYVFMLIKMAELPKRSVSMETGVSERGKVPRRKVMDEQGRE